MEMTSKEVLEKLRRLAVSSESDLSNSTIVREYTAIIEKDLDILDILIKNIDIINNEKAPIFITILTDNEDWQIVKDYLKENK